MGLLQEIGKGIRNALIGVPSEVIVSSPVLGAGMMMNMDEYSDIKSCGGTTTFLLSDSLVGCGGLKSPFMGLDPSGNAIGNSAVYSCLSALVMGFCEADLGVLHGEVLNKEHELSGIFEQPNGSSGQKDIMALMVSQAYLGGAAFVEMLLDKGKKGWNLVGFDVHGVNNVERDMVTGKVLRVLRRDVQQWEEVDNSDFIVLRWPVMNPHDPFIGLSPVRALSSELSADRSALGMIEETISNDGIPFAALKLPPEVKLDDESKENMRKEFEQRRRRRDQLAFLEGGAEWSRPNMSLSELDLENVFLTSESRVSGASRVPAIIAGLQTGLKHATYSNFENARSMFTETTLMSLWSSWGSALTSGLRREKVIARDESVGFDTTKVAGLTEYRRRISEGVRQDYLSGIITLDEARNRLGYAAMDESKNDVYLKRNGSGQRKELWLQKDSKQG